MILASLLSSSSFIITNKILIKAVGTDAAIILGELCSEYNYWEQKNGLRDKEWFYSTRENIEENTGLSEHKQRMAINKLLDMDLIKTQKMGIPCKTYYKLNENKILNCYNNTQKSMKTPKNSVVENLDNKTSKNSTSSDTNFEEQEVENLDINNNKNNNNKNHTHEPNDNEEKIECAKQVTMTKKEYQDLVNTYGELTTQKLIEQLNLYKQSKGINYDNDYSAILRWVTTRLHEMEKEQTNYDNFKNKEKSKSYIKPNFTQREYPPDFFDSLYEN